MIYARATDLFATTDIHCYAHSFTHSCNEVTYHKERINQKIKSFSSFSTGERQITSYRLRQRGQELNPERTEDKKPYQVPEVEIRIVHALSNSNVFGVLQTNPVSIMKAFQEFTLLFASSERKLSGLLWS